MSLPLICVTGPEARVRFPRRVEEAEMNMLGRVVHALRVWTGLADVNESRLTPSHGWLLPAAAEARQHRTAGRTDRATRGDLGVHP